MNTEELKNELSKLEVQQKIQKDKMYALDKEIRELLHQLDTCDQPSNCPHGRPTWIRWSLKDLEKLFKRIV